MSVKHHIYLVPGFFGFTNLGELVYYGHVRDFLEAEFARRGVEAEVGWIFGTVRVDSHFTWLDAEDRVRKEALLRRPEESAGLVATWAPGDWMLSAEGHASEVSVMRMAIAEVSMSMP